jgi:acetyl-CoA synthetase
LARCGAPTGRQRERTALWPALERASDALAAEDTGPDDPAVIIYTSGTTGQPKGALHGHRVLLGHLPGVQMPQDFFPQPGDRFWTPADWAWIGGLFDVLLPSLYFGVPVVAWRAAKFDPEAACAFMARHGVRNVFMPPTALRFMRRRASTRWRGACGCARWPAAASGWATRPWPGSPSGSGSR